MKFIESIKIAYSGKFTRLNVIDHGACASWTPWEDHSWLEYKKARDQIRNHKLLERILLFFKII